MTIIVTTRVGNPSPTVTDTPDGIDYAAEIHVTDEAGITSVWQGSLIFAPDRINRGFAPVGDSRDCWMSPEMIQAIETPWIAAHEHLVNAIVESLRSGEGIETFEVEVP